MNSKWLALSAMSEMTVTPKIAWYSLQPNFSCFQMKNRMKLVWQLTVMHCTNVRLLSKVSTRCFTTWNWKWPIKSSWVGNIIWWRQCSDTVSPASGESKGCGAWQVGENLISKNKSRINNNNKLLIINFVLIVTFYRGNKKIIKLNRVLAALELPYSCRGIVEPGSQVRYYFDR